MSDPVEVLHDITAQRFEATVKGLLSVCDYEVEGDRMVFTHTAVPPELRGRGVAEQLVRAGLAAARDRGMRVVPACSYVAAFIARNREFEDLLAD